MHCDEIVNETLVDVDCTASARPTSAPSLSYAPSFTSQPSMAVDCTCVPGEFRFELEVKTDDFPDETSWELRNNDGEVTQSVEEGGYDGSHQITFNYTYCLSAGNYTFTIFDSSSDGFCCEFGNGYYEGNIHGRTQIFKGNKFSGQETHSFSGEDLC